mgnify:FL=1
MAIVISDVPSTTLRALGAVQLDRTGTSPVTAADRAVAFGQKTSGGSATALTLYAVPSVAAARALFGQGSHLALICEAWLANAPGIPLYAVPMADNGTTKSVRTITVTGTATSAGTLSLQHAGIPIDVGVDVGDDATAIATSITAAIADMPWLPSSASSSAEVVTLTARNAGTNGNQCGLRVNYAPGQRYPGGVSVAFAQTTSGATDPTTSTQTNALAAIASEDFRYLVWPYTADGSLDVLEAELVDRWSATRGLTTLAFNCLDDTVSNLTTASADRNSPHLSMLGVYSSPTPSWQLAAAYAGACAKSLTTHPAVPLAEIALRGVQAPANAARFTATEANTLGLDGIASTYVDAFGQVRINLAVTCYKTDGNGSADSTLRWLNSVAQVAYLVRDIKATVRSYCSGKILVDDASLVSPGTPALDTGMIKRRLVARYADHQANAVVENLAAFAEALVVERNVSDPNRVDVLYPPDLANQLNVLAVLVRPYLELPE